MLARRWFALVVIMGLLAASCGGGAAAPTGAPAQPTATSPARVPSTAAPSTPTPPPVSRYGGTLRADLTGNYSKLEAVTGTGGNDHFFLWAAFNNLVGYGPDFAPDPDRSLASRWETPDPLTYVFYLKRGITFQDGTPFNAEAVKENFKYATDPNVKSNVRSDLGPVQDVEVIDEFTAKYRLKTQSAGLLATLGDRAGFMSSPAAIKKWGADYGLHPVGTGAFEFVEQVIDDHVTVKRWEGYWGKDKQGNRLPYLDQVIWRSTPNPDTALVAFKTGQLDVLYGVPVASVESLRSDPKVRFVSYSGWGSGYWHLKWNAPPFDNVHLRRAFAYTVDRKAIIDKLLFGLAKPIIGPIGSAHWAYNPNLRPQVFDLEKAREELRLGGKPDGFRFSLSLPNTPSSIAIAEFTKASAAKVGIDMALLVKGSPEFYLDYINKGLGEALAAGVSARADPTVSFNFSWHPEGVYRQTVGTELKDMVERVGTTYDPVQRQKAIDELTQKLVDDAYSVFLYQPDYLLAFWPYVHLTTFADGKHHFGHGDIWMEKR